MPDEVSLLCFDAIQTIWRNHVEMYKCRTFEIWTQVARHLLKMLDLTWQVYNSNSFTSLERSANQHCKLYLCVIPPKRSVENLPSLYPYDSSLSSYLLWSDPGFRSCWQLMIDLWGILLRANTVLFRKRNVIFEIRVRWGILVQSCEVDVLSSA